MCQSDRYGSDKTRETDMAHIVLVQYAYVVIYYIFKSMASKSIIVAFRQTVHIDKMAHTHKVT